MKVILSRKGFDSTNGGILSPIIDNRIMLSLPIPSKDKKKDNIKYEELTCAEVGLDKILLDLGYDLNKQPDCVCVKYSLANFLTFFFYHCFFIFLYHK